MITVTFDLKDKTAARIFGQAIVNYADDEATAEVKPPGTLDIEATKDVAEVAPPPPAPVVVEAEVTPPPPIPWAEQVDENGVLFNDDFCGKAKIPFYATGKNERQWKRKVGVDEESYNIWYAGENIKAHTAPVIEVVRVPDTVVPADDVPDGAGALMVWISEQQNAGKLTQADVDSGYSTAGVTPGDLFSGADGAVGKLYSVLNARVAA